ncbi:MAG: glycoside hydrolase family 9 protein, partial [Acidobacteriota bacterium]|nr:glycoside hydrolase family 9 protein [Acidobacteriota bacterium]
NSVGTVVASGWVGAKLGSWGTYSVYPIDFIVTAVSRCTMSVSGVVSATSSSFRVDTPANLYATPLANNLYFHENQRDGTNFVRTPLRTAAGHLNDTNATVYSTPTFDNNDLVIGSLSPTGATIDAEGGWWDAGDYLKFVETHSYVVALMLIGIRDFPNQMGSSSATSNFSYEAQFGVSWLQRMWDDSTRTLYYQVGIGTDFKNFNYQSDHDVWRLPQADDTFGGTDPQFQYIRNRPVFVAGPAGAKISPNLAGRLAASFAECFEVFQTTNVTLANQCISAAEHIFDLANASPSGTLLTVAPYSFYPETEWRDDLELGATELFFALRRGNLPAGLPHTDPLYYLRQGANWASAYIASTNDGADTLNLYDVSGLAHFELYRAISLACSPSGLAVTQAQLLADINKQIRASVNRDHNDPFGYGLPWNTYDSVSHGAGLSVMAAEYNYLSSNSSYAADSRRWLANISGANAWGVSFTAGDGTIFPLCMHHQVANIAGSSNGQTPVLAGAVVEGSNSAATSGLITGMATCPAGGGDVYKKFNGNGSTYRDEVQSYSTNEPAIDLSATSFLMYSWRMSGGPNGTP